MVERKKWEAPVNLYQCRQTKLTIESGESFENNTKLNHEKRLGFYLAQCTEQFNIYIFILILYKSVSL